MSPSSWQTELEWNWDHLISVSRGHKHEGDLLGQQSPDKMDVTLDEDYQEIQVELKPTREELIAKYQVNVQILLWSNVLKALTGLYLIRQQMLEEKEKLQAANNQFHNKLADYFRKKKPDESLSQQQLFEKNSPEQEQRYQKYLGKLSPVHSDLW